MAGYILPITKIDTEKPRLLECGTGANNLDLSFDIAPHPSSEALTTCDYSCVGNDITITSPVQSLPPSPENLIETVTAAANTHSQVMERKKLMW